jgi:hypothetical protein
MDDASNDGLIASAAAVINPHLVPAMASVSSVMVSGPGG